MLTLLDNPAAMFAAAAAEGLLSGGGIGRVVTTCEICLEKKLSTCCIARSKHNTYQYMH